METQTTEKQAVKIKPTPESSQNFFHSLRHIIAELATLPSNSASDKSA